jgi:AcrR family transcriptional regulator
MSIETKEKIMKKTLQLFAREGYSGVSMRTLADEVPIAQSVLYHYFRDKDALLKEMFDSTSTKLGIIRSQLPKPESAVIMLRQRILFQIDHAEEIVAVLKYYLAYRKQFVKNETGFVPEKTSLHIEEVLRYGLRTGEFQVDDVVHDAKVITHAINGFLLEYFPHKPKGRERDKLADTIHSFLLRALVK